MEAQRAIQLAAVLKGRVWSPDPGTINDDWLVLIYRTDGACVCINEDAAEEYATRKDFFDGAAAVKRIEFSPHQTGLLLSDDAV